MNELIKAKIVSSPGRNRSLAAIAGFLLACVATDTALALTLRSESLVGGFQRPIFARGAPGDTSSLYVLEEFLQNVTKVDLETKQKTTFLDLTNVGLGSERGLKGMAFHPDFEQNGKFYVHQFDAEAHRINILEFTRSTTNPSIADPASQRTILSFDHHPSNVDHTAGWIGFSPVDNYLYIPTGDGGSTYDVNNKDTAHNLSAQDLDDIRGKVLRIDVDGDDFPANDDKNFAIPESNPFAEGGGLPEIYALGVRSPFRASIDRQTGDFYLGDVGSVRYEEVNLIPQESGGGQNFGWRTREGSFPNPTFSDDPPIENPTDPIFEYANAGGAAIVGGYVYRGSNIPELQGHYIYTDFVKRNFTTFLPGEDGVTQIVNRTADLRNPLSATGNYQAVTSFGEDTSGELYIVDYIGGRVYAITQGLDGDYDNSGTVDAADYDLWKSSFGDTSDLYADGNRDGVVNLADYTVWRNNLGASLSEALANSQAQSVPEPTGALLLGLALVAAAGLVRRPAA